MPDSAANGRSSWRSVVSVLHEFLRFRERSVICHLSVGHFVFVSGPRSRSRQVSGPRRNGRPQVSREISSPPATRWANSGHPRTTRLSSLIIHPTSLILPPPWIAAPRPPARPLCHPIAMVRSAPPRSGTCRSAARRWRGPYRTADLRSPPRRRPARPGSWVQRDDHVHHAMPKVTLRRV